MLRCCENRTAVGRSGLGASDGPISTFIVEVTRPTKFDGLKRSMSAETPQFLADILSDAKWSGPNSPRCSTALVARTSASACCLRLLARGMLMPACVVCLKQNIDVNKGSVAALAIADGKSCNRTPLPSAHPPVAPPGENPIVPPASQPDERHATVENALSGEHCAATGKTAAWFYRRVFAARLSRGLHQHP